MSTPSPDDESRAITMQNLDNLPTTLDAKQVAEMWGCSPWAVYAMVKAGTAPVAPLRLGRCLRWPTALVLESVGMRIFTEYERD